MGAQNPVNPIKNLYDAYDNAYDEIVEFKAKNPLALQGGDQSVADATMDFNDDAKKFSSKLDELDQKFKEMERVSQD